ncbi:hypothetical protein CYMTET_4857 [Cymbomonas tetramitiformis]|uniref:Uncharacterized protein n=1 Tax=Cymbomonas tetramitiformis TaxID=36881 RepID=A0AAE0H0I5_9CHLO|nr:hypothetical protein CYMTET_4857 [Cymbomonas tetramitiformis]|eukprot:gene3585-4513_t
MSESNRPAWLDDKDSEEMKKSASQAEYIVSRLPEFGSLMSGNFSTRDAAKLLAEAVAQGYLELTVTLLDRGADVNSVQRFHVPALLRVQEQVKEHREEDDSWVVKEKPHKVKIVDLLLKHGADIHAHRSRGYTALHDAVAAGDIETMKLLIANGADVNGREVRNDGGSKQYTPVFHKCANLDEGVDASVVPEMIKILVDAGADINRQDNDQKTTALHETVFKGKCEIAKALIAAGISPEIRDERSLTALELAKKVNNPNDIVQCLKDCGARDYVEEEKIAAQSAQVKACCTIV